MTRQQKETQFLVPLWLECNWYIKYHNVQIFLFLKITFANSLLIRIRILFAFPFPHPGILSCLSLFGSCSCYNSVYLLISTSALWFLEDTFLDSSTTLFTLLSCLLFHISTWALRRGVWYRHPISRSG